MKRGLLIVISKKNLSEDKNRRAKEIGVKTNAKMGMKMNRFESRNSPTFLTYLATTFLILVIFPLAIKCFYIDQKQSPQLHEWSYGDQLDWRRENKQCGLKNQSPIDIQRRYVIPSNHLKLHFYNYNQYIKFKIQNAHHTIKLNPIDLFANDQFGIKLNQNPDESMASSINKASLPEITTNEDDMEPEYEAKAPVNNNKYNDRHNNHQGQNHREQTRIKVDRQGLEKENKSHQSSNYNNQQHNQGLDSNSIGIIDENINVEDGAQSGTSSSATSLPYNGAPTIKLDWLDDGNNEYKLHDIHFHWGERRDNGSEHAIDGRRAAMEVSISVFC